MARPSDEKPVTPATPATPTPPGKTPTTPTEEPVISPAIPTPTGPPEQPPGRPDLPPGRPDLPPGQAAERPTPPPFDPSVISPDAVKTVGGRKYGWQNARQNTDDTSDPETCAHTGVRVARTALKAQPDQYPIGGEWLCVCGQVFEVVIGEGGNKILKEKNEEVSDE